MTFNLKHHLAQIREGRADLTRTRAEAVDRLDELESQADEVRDHLKQIDADIAAIDALDLDPVIGPAPVRMSGVLKLVTEVVDELLHNKSVVAEGEIVVAVREREAAAKESSIRSSLARLVEKGVITRDGPRGARVYARGDAGAADPKDVRNSVIDALAQAGDKGLTKRDLAWATGDAAILDEALRDQAIVSYVIDGTAETRYRLRTDVLGQRPLFDGADPPPSHANDGK
jgi:DNA-binding PadR family transcriptional regulator